MPISMPGAWRTRRIRATCRTTCVPSGRSRSPGMRLRSCWCLRSTPSIAGRMHRRTSSTSTSTWMATASTTMSWSARIRAPSPPALTTAGWARSSSACAPAPAFWTSLRPRRPTARPHCCRCFHVAQCGEVRARRLPLHDRWCCRAAQVPAPLRTTDGRRNTKATPHAQWQTPRRREPPLRSFASTKVVRLAGIEPTTPWFVAKYSIQLSYSRSACIVSAGFRHPRRAAAS